MSDPIATAFVVGLVIGFLLGLLGPFLDEQGKLPRRKP